MEEQTIDNTLSGVCAAESLKFYALFMSMRMKGDLPTDSAFCIVNWLLFSLRIGTTHMTSLNG